MRVPTYIIFCKVCKKDQEYELKLEDDLIGGSHTDTDPKTSGIAHLFLNCHSCNDYAVYVGKIVVERYRYKAYETKSNLEKPIKFAFGWRYQ